MSSVMTAPLELRLATDDDTPAVLELVRGSLGEDYAPATPEYWRWKHGENPFGRSPCLLAEADGVLVGLRVFMRWQWDSAGRTVQAVRAVDTATHRAWRGRGVFSRLTLALVEEMTAERVGFVFNTPNAQSRPGYLKMGWTSLGKTALWLRICRPIRVAQALATKATAEPRHATSGDREADGFPDVSTLLAESRLDELLASWPRTDTRLTTRPTREYLAWRYASIPAFRYHAVWQLDGDGPAALIFRFKQRGALRELRLCDLLVTGAPASVRTAASLARLVVATAGADYAAAMAGAGTPEQAALLRAAFFPAPRIGPIFTVRPLVADACPVDPTAAANWRHSIGSLELF